MKGVLSEFVRMAVVSAAMTISLAGQQVAPSAQPGSVPTSPPADSGVALPAGYVIGAEDVLSVVFWRDKDMSADVVVRPDGKISLPLINDVQAAGHTPDSLRAVLIKVATKFVQEPNATVVVKEIHSRKIYVTGMVLKGGTFPLVGDMTVMQAIALAGGLQEYADAKNIVIIRKEGGNERYFKFNYKDVVKQKNVGQNIPLKPGDTVVVP